MKLAEALIKVKELREQLGEVSTTISQSMTYFADEKPLYSVDELYEQRQAIIKELDTYKYKIAMTNLNTKVGDISIQQLIWEMGRAKEEITALAGLSIKTQQGYGYEGRTTDTIKTVMNYDPLKYAAKKKEAAAKMKELDILLQKTNWEAELVD